MDGNNWDAATDAHGGYALTRPSSRRRGWKGDLGLDRLGRAAPALRGVRSRRTPLFPAGNRPGSRQRSRQTSPGAGRCRPSRGGQITQAYEQGDRLALHFDNQTSVVLQLENPGNAVSVRDGQNKVLYLG